MKSTIRFIDAKTGKRISARAASSILYQAIKKRKREEVRRQARSKKH